MTDETVYVAGQVGGTGSSVYHTDRECRVLQRANSIIQWPRSSMEISRTLCKFCADEFEPRGSGDGHIQSLRAAAAERGGDA